MASRWSHSTRAIRVARSLAVLAGLAAWGLSAVSVARAEPAGPSALGFTEAQAARGKAQYVQHCASCHGPDLLGIDIAPSLAGEQFDQVWRGQPAELLLAGIARMPLDGPGKLGAVVHAEILAYVLQVNGMPAGGEALPDAPEALAGRLIPGTRAAPAAPVGLGVASDPPGGSARLRALTPVTDAMLADPPPGEWLTWRRTYDAQGYSALAQITKANVAGLRRAWTAPLPSGPGQATPLVHDGVMFLYHFPDTVRAMDAATGEVLWTFTRQPSRRPSRKLGIALHGDKVIVPTSDLHLLALDFRTGKVVWDHEIALDQRWRHDLRSAPLVAKGKVIQGIQGIGVPGGNFIVALDIETGQEAWRFRTVPKPGEPGGDTWNDLPIEKRSGGSVWVPGSYDPELGLVYFGTGNSYETAALLSPVRPGAKNDALYTNTTLALDPDTGKLVWHYQHMPNDQWDHDWAFERQVIELEVAGKPRKVVLTGGKLAIFEALDAATGAYLFSIDLGLQDLVTAIDPATGTKTVRPTALPDPKRSTLVCPGALGARNWPATSYDPRSGLLYVPIAARCGTSFPTDAWPRARRGFGRGRSAMQDPEEDEPSAGGAGEMHGRVQAVDLRGRKLGWSHRQAAGFTSATLATAGGLVFAGSADRWLHAFDSESGDILWREHLDAIASSFPITYSVDGRQYVAVVIGQTNLHQRSWSREARRTEAGESETTAAGGGGTAVWVFSLPEEAGERATETPSAPQDGSVPAEAR